MRHRPARAMYDQLEDTLTSITMQLRSAIEADASMPSKAKGLGDPLKRDNGWARKVSAELGSVLLDTLGLAATIEWHVRQFQKCTGIRCELTVSSADSFELPENYSEAIFDIYNEALSNVARHAGANRVAIALTVARHEVTMVIRDNGIGLASEVPASGDGGLAVIRANSQTYKGFCEIAGARHTGTTVTVSLPIA